MSSWSFFKKLGHPDFAIDIAGYRVFGCGSSVWKVELIGGYRPTSDDQPHRHEGSLVGLNGRSSFAVEKLIEVIAPASAKWQETADSVELPLF